MLCTIVALQVDAASFCGLPWAGALGVPSSSAIAAAPASRRTGPSCCIALHLVRAGALLGCCSEGRSRRMGRTAAMRAGLPGDAYAWV